MKSDLRDVWQAKTGAAATAAMGTFAEEVGTRYAVACLTSDCEALLAFFNFPAEHWMRAIKFTDFERRQIAAVRNDLDQEYRTQLGNITATLAPSSPARFPGL